MFNQAKRISTFFTFNGNGEEAFNFYLDTFPDAKKIGLTYFTKPEQGGDIGKVLNATFEIKGASFMIMDMTNNASLTLAGPQQPFILQTQKMNSIPFLKNWLKKVRL